MAGARQPTNLVLLKGKKHFTKAELEQRKSRDVVAPVDRISPPEFLKSKAQKEKFIDLACGLLDAQIMSNLDCDALAIFIQSEEKYLQYDKYVTQILQSINAHEASGGQSIQLLADMAQPLKDYEGLRDKALKQCRSAAMDLGLTISSRCKLAIPKKAEEEDQNAGLFGDAQVI